MEIVDWVAGVELWRLGEKTEKVIEEPRTSRGGVGAEHPLFEMDVRRRAHPLWETGGLGREQRGEGCAGGLEVVVVEDAEVAPEGGWVEAELGVRIHGSGAGVC
jgi:hypothetical protein